MDGIAASLSLLAMTHMNISGTYGVARSLCKVEETEGNPVRFQAASARTSRRRGTVRSGMAA
jgi:hypothetical protein